MEKKLCILLLAVMIVLVITQYAYANEEKTAPVLYGFDYSKETSLWAEMLGFDQPLTNIVPKGGHDYLTDLLQEYRPDFFRADVTRANPKELYQAGLIEAFEPTEAMLREISEMPRYLQNLFRDELMTEDGKLLGYPSSSYGVFEAPLFIGYWIPDAWQASPFRDMTPPSSFEELLDFIEVFLDTPHDGFRLFWAPDKASYRAELLQDPLLQGWIIQSLYAGKPVTFSDPQFIVLADRAQKLGKRLLKEDYRTKRNTTVRYLFAYCQQVGYSFNEKDTFTCANIIPLRMTADQPPLISEYYGELCYVTKNSPWAAYAGELFGTAIPHVATFSGVTCYSRMAFPDKVDLEAKNLSTKKNGVKYYLMTREWLNSVKDLDQYIIATLGRDPFPPSQYGEWMWAANQFYTKGTMTAEAYAAELDRIIASGISGTNNKDIWIVEYEDE